ncbi:sporulation protein [Streptomyces cyaneofuscatus]|uniref:sporulation protein n=1 Tax=Streptomyces cyaneofuscatus TaxID=66883 RepID=UPI00379E73AB
MGNRPQSGVAGRDFSAAPLSGAPLAPRYPLEYRGSGQQLAFHQEAELVPAPHHAQQVREIEETFPADPAGKEVVPRPDRGPVRWPPWVLPPPHCGSPGGSGRRPPR